MAPIHENLAYKDFPTPDVGQPTGIFGSFYVAPSPTPEADVPADGGDTNTGGGDTGGGTGDDGVIL